ncbi:MAG: glycosyltransferase [Ignavibacteriae bacterium]|nr:glycosyltransferase [Ignavibacteriota bacterium]
MSTLSVCCLARNEELFLPKMLASVRDIADEIIILDTGSTDATIELAKAFGARVEIADWNDDFGAMRNKVLSYATKDWVLMLDADELVYAERIHESVDVSLRKQTLMPLQSEIEIHHYGFTDGKPLRRIRNRRSFEAELNKNPTDSFVRTHLALSLFLEKDYHKAESYFDIILTTQSRDLTPEARSIIMALLAEIYRLQQKPVQAKMQAQRAMRLMGGNSLAEYIMALVDIDEKLYEVAERRLQTIDSNMLTQRFFSVHKGELYTEIIKCSLRGGKFDQAFQYAELMLETPTHDGMMIGGALCEKKRDYTTALKFYQHALPISPVPSEVQAKIENVERILAAQEAQE